MLARYHMKRGTPAAELPDGLGQDTRKHTRHALRFMTARFPDLQVVVPGA